MEYGLAECLPLYSGGLGVLSGDYLKAASDLGLPVVGIGLAYRQGYFQQRLDADGHQYELYPQNDFDVSRFSPSSTKVASASRFRFRFTIAS